MWVEELQNGKYRAVERYTDYLTGKQKKVSVTIEKNTAQSRKIAQKTLDIKMDKALQANTEKRYTMGDLVDAYRKEQSKTVKPSTYSRNYHVCNTLMEILGKDTILDRMTGKYIRQKFLATEKDAGYLNEKLVRLKALIRWGSQNDYIKDISFLDKLKPFKDTSYREKIQDKYLEASELKALLSKMEVPIWRALTEFLALTGLRVGEAAALNVEDVDLQERIIHVTKTYDANNEVTTGTKTLASTRDVYIQDELVSVIKQLRTLMLYQRMQCGYPKPELFLTDKNGEHIKYFAYRKYLRENSEKVIGRPITPHALRHTHASLMFEQGISIDIISRRLGHESSDITRQIYLHITKKLKEKDNEAISKVKIM